MKQSDLSLILASVYAAGNMDPLSRCIATLIMLTVWVASVIFRRSDEP